MSFRCQSCNKKVPPRTSVKFVVTTRREKKYPFRPNANAVKKHRKIEFSPDKGGKGHEIVKELALCSTCAKAYEEG